MTRAKGHGDLDVQEALDGASRSTPWAAPHRIATSRDGTRIAFYEHPGRTPDAPVLLLANGLGGPPGAWSALVDHLGDRYRFVTWDYRGLYASERPRPDVTEAYAVERQVDDLEAVAAAAGIERASLLGWSMGVQVALEAAHRRPELAERLVLMNGTFGRPLDTALPVRWSARVMRPALALTERFAQPVSRALRAASQSRTTARAMKLVGTLSQAADDDRFLAIASVFGTLDVEVFSKTLQALGTHDAEPYVERLAAPTLVVAGEIDRVTPAALSQSMAARMRHAELVVVRGATHYAAVEFPEYVGLRVERFLDAHPV